MQPTQVYPYLEQIIQPADLHRLADKELAEVAREVRQAILDSVSKTGGHFSSNLGAVELTVAMYAAYRIPPDKVVWDTGHQAYAHKLLTGRLPRFDTLRKHKGLSGFLSRREHELDVFGAGHAGTAISAAVGFAVARDKMNTGERVAAVTGDAAICSGMCWEALNHAGEMGSDLCVVLNDNRMSIAPNVGALTSYFTRLRSRSFVQNWAQRAKHLIEQIPGPAPRIAAGLRHGITHYFAPEETGTIFEEMGFEYIGPIDGHDLPSMLEIFRNVREIKGPVFVHAITVKGKGYAVAEDDATKWHGVIPFDLEACEMSKSAGPVTYTQAFGDAIVEIAKEDSRVCAITAAMPDGTGLVPFSRELPERYFDVGIAEQHAVTFAAGLAAGGLKPFCTIYSTFLQRAFDQVLHDVCLQNLPVRFFMDRAGLVGDDGPTHHGAFDISYLTCIPNLKLMAPRDTTELREMVRFAAQYGSSPLAVRYPRGAGDPALPEGRTPIQEHSAEVLSRGTDVTIVAVGSMVAQSWHAARLLEERGISATVVNARWVVPFDAETIFEDATSTKRLITVEENVERGGFGEMVQNEWRKRGLHHTVAFDLAALPNAFVEHGSQAILREEVGLSAERLADRIEAFVVASKTAPQG